MKDLNFNRWNTIIGWVVFAIAITTYTLTVEPTLSFWDSGEYIATAANLEVGHPPGAPLYQMIGAFFAMFAIGKENVALMVNMMSAFSSAFAILFMFWSSTILLKKFIVKVTEESTHSNLMILGSSAVGALTLTFSDSFWFNAVETEVYSMASLFISVLVYLGLRWEQDMLTSRGNKWLLLISLVIGLSFGVHFMALLTIPSIGLLYFFKHYPKVTTKNFIIANIVVVFILLFIFKLLLPYTMTLFGATEVFMVNTFGLPFDSGTIFVTALLIAGFYYGLNYTQKKGNVKLNTLLLSILFIFIGFSTWMMLPIRANANTVINENKPSDAREVLAYYNREQYGVNPLFYGPQFSDTYAGLDPDNPYKDGAKNFERNYETGKYDIVNNYINAEQNSDDRHKTFLPRMWSTDHAVNYMSFSNPLKFRIDPEYAHEKQLVDLVAGFRTAFNNGEVDLDGYHKFLKTYSEYLIVEKPTTADNLKYMFEYQFSYMYWRYLMWNFAGRQSDNQGKYDNLEGNWMTGIKYLDEIRLGSQENLPSDVKNNKGRNLYYALPFILGILGMIYHAQRERKSFYVLLVLFLFTGLVLKVYLNERPFEVRERDYALVGSFYVFALWVGIGAYAIFDYLRKYLNPKLAMPVVLATTLLASPVLMASQNWDDHDRSQKYTALAMAKAYLSSCEPNAILYSIGDNDTFPLWYAQEIEGFRTDVRIVNTALFMTDWYIDQMKRQAYESKPLPISLNHNHYVGDKLNYSIHTPKTEARWNITDFIKFIAYDERSILEMNNGQKIHFFPTNKIRVPVNKDKVIKNKVVNPHLYDSIVPYIDIDIEGQALYKNRLLMLDILANNDWERPIYFTGGSFGNDDYLWMKDYLQLDGMVYKLIPVKTSIADAASPIDMGVIDSNKMYNIVKQWDWGNSESEHIYHDPETRKNSISYRTNLARLMEQLINEGDHKKAKEIIDLAMEKMPLQKFGYYTMVEPFVAGYYEVGEKEKARDILNQLMIKYQENLDYYKEFRINDQNDYYVEIVTSIERYRDLLNLMKDSKDLEYFNKHKAKFNTYNSYFSRFERENE